MMQMLHKYLLLCGKFKFVFWSCLNFLKIFLFCAILVFVIITLILSQHNTIWKIWGAYAIFINM